ncbi:hypothetical protein D3C78_1784160 [compost metagenome]
MIRAIHVSPRIPAQINNQLLIFGVSNTVEFFNKTIVGIMIKFMNTEIGDGPLIFIDHVLAGRRC